MAKNTSNYNLKKPSPEDFYNVEDQNGNMDIIDQELERLNEDNQNTDQKISSVSSDLSSHLSDIAHVPHLGTASNAGNAYSITTTKVIGVNQKFTIRFNVPATGPATLKLSTMTAAAPIKKTGLVDAVVKFGYYTLFWDGVNFQLLGEGGEIPRLQNWVKNGAFNSGLNNWTFVGAGILALDATIFHTAPQSLKQTVINGVYVQDIPDLVVGHKIYVCAWGYITTLYSVVAGLMDYGANTGYVLASGDGSKLNQWQFCSAIKTITTTGVRVCAGYYHNNITATLYVDDIMAIDLTDAFGSGNEPTKEEMDAMVLARGGWWDSGLVTLTKDATATSTQILSNKTAYIAGDKWLGTMPNRTLEAVGGPTWVESVKAYSDGTLTLRPKEGYYKSEVNESGYGPIAATDPNFIPANIVSGKSIFGVTGTGVGFPDGWNEVVSARAWESITKFDPIILKKMGIWENGVNKLTNPSVLPTESSWGCSFSPDGNYLAIGSSNSPFLIIYKRNGDTFIKLADPAVLPYGIVWGCSFSPDGNYLAVVNSGSPYLTIYKRNGDTFTKLDVPIGSIYTNAWCCSFSPNSNYLAVGVVVDNGSSYSYLTIYKRNGDTFIKLADPAVSPTGNARSCSFSPDGNYLAVAHEIWPRLTIYKRNGDTFIKLADPAVLPAGGGEGCSFSPDGNYLAVTYDGEPYLIIYKRNGDTFTKLTNPAVLPIGGTQACTFSSDGNYLAVGSANLPFLIIYKRNGDTFTKLPDPTNVTPTAMNSSFSSDGNYLAVSCYQPPYVTIYKSDAYDSIQKLVRKSQYFYSPPAEWKFGIANETKSAGEIGKVTLFPKIYNLSNV